FRKCVWQPYEVTQPDIIIIYGIFTGQDPKDNTVSDRDGKFPPHHHARVEYTIDFFQSVIYTPSYNYGYNTSNYITNSDIFTGETP
ncbi:MAG: hypothetical protein IPI42_06440, partial [Saprospiraceae bacterium]|nr:hypothetical protein [Candidatus Parvibacillus calidus]